VEGKPSTQCDMVQFFLFSISLSFSIGAKESSHFSSFILFSSRSISYLLVQQLL
jgi:hypothetical protein